MIRSGRRRRRNYLDAACLRDDARRLMVAQMALLFGPERLRERLEQWFEGSLTEEDARALRADLDAMAGQLLSR